MESIEYMDNRHIEETNRSCYRFEKIEFNDSGGGGGGALLDIDATYIIHLENNGRLDSVKEQLNKFRPTKSVYILHNKGYRKCKKDDYINTPPLDLVDAFWHIFKDAQQKNFNNILILEDDFMFNERIRDIKVQQNIMDFIRNRNYDVYSLGLLPFLQSAYNNTTNICLLGGGTHAMIYSRDCINKVLHDDKRSIKDWDLYIATKYVYNEPLCYQLFPETENQKHWENDIGVRTQKYTINKLKLDVQVEPGYSIMYAVSRGLYGLCIIVIVLLFITVFKVYDL